MNTSESLNLFSLYSRNDLKKLFQIKDATINNGIFKPKGHSSVWLFVTKNKTLDHTDYYDDLDGSKLTFEGQTAGRTDQMILDHEIDGNEIILFYREKGTNTRNMRLNIVGDSNTKAIQETNRKDLFFMQWIWAFQIYELRFRIPGSFSLK
ncbi:hypothetical protein [Methanogenium cariaci]|uniref:hypothetical protein n=1 Tax=Methanogenium cariaci TaxID=2197 RepID=UPI0007843803|nr:hypothetical protein [Methanogenium cariaci]